MPIVDPVGKARRVIDPSRDAKTGKQATELLHGRRAMERHGEALVVVDPLPAGQRPARLVEGDEAMAAPEFLVVDAVAPFDFAVLLGTARADVAQLNAGFLDGERERQRELGTVITLEAPNPEGQSAAHLGKKSMDARWFCSR